MTVKRRPRLLCIGDLNADISITTDSAIAVGSDTPGTVRLTGGGSAANVAAWASRANAPAIHTRFVGVIGDDLIGRFLVDELAGHGVEAFPVVRDRASSRSVAALVGADGDRSMVSDLSTDTVLGATDLVPGWFDDVDWLHLTAYTWFPSNGPEVVAALVALARERSIPWSIDPSSAQMFAGDRSPVQARDAFAGASLLFPNHDEASLLSGTEDPALAAEALLEVAETVVVTCGVDGAVVARRDTATFVAAAHDSDVVNALGAGDAFAGGFLAGRLGGSDDRVSIEIAFESAARAVGLPSAR